LAPIFSPSHASRLWNSQRTNDFSPSDFFPAFEEEGSGLLSLYALFDVMIAGDVFFKDFFLPRPSQVGDDDSPSSKVNGFQYRFFRAW